MATTDKRIDAYIAKAQPFAQPILQHIRFLVHKVCPVAEETIKWGFPHFEYKGAILCSMAAFRQHCAFGFWKASIIKDPEKILHVGEKASMGHFNKIASLKDLPSDKIFTAYIKQAAQLNEEGVQLPPKAKTTSATPVEVPGDVQKALQKNKKAVEVFNAFAPSHRKEYLQWITEAKTEPTRNKRIETMIEWLKEGKSRNWKYEKKV
ncbi:MAG: YdeI/OmpD-associated family protein [Agriterribacter sp.]